MVVRLRDRNVLGANGRDVPLGTGVADAQKFLLDVAKQEPAPQEEPNKCVNCSRPYGGIKPLFIALDVDPWQVIIATGPQPGTSRGAFAELWRQADDFERVVRPAMGYRVEQDAKLIPITSTDRIPADVKEKIVAALPKHALVTPRRTPGSFWSSIWLRQGPTITTPRHMPTSPFRRWRRQRARTRRSSAMI